MKYVILASHGRLASGMKRSIEMIAGIHSNICAIDAYEEDSKDFSKEIKLIIDEHSTDDVIIITDLLGGSVNNEVLRYKDLKNVHIVTGMNMPLVLNIVIKDDENINKLINDNISECKKMILFFDNETIGNEKNDEDF